MAFLQWRMDYSNPFVDKNKEEIEDLI